MSDPIMWDDKKYKMNWEEIVVWDEKNIKGFFGNNFETEFRWLSNFWPCTVYFEGLKFNSVENSYIAAKTEDLEIRKKIQGMSAYEAKKFGHSLKLRDGWQEMRLDVMLECLIQKFLRNPELRCKLIETGDKYLEERNWWSDRFFGTDLEGNGENHLGRLLMKVRECLK